MSQYQLQVLNSTPYHQHWLHKNKNKKFKYTHLDIKDEKLVSTIIQDNDYKLFHLQPEKLYIIILRVEHDDYILLTTNKQTDLATGYSNFLQLPTKIMDPFINLSINEKDIRPLTFPKQFCHDDSNKLNDYDNHLIGWWTNPNFTSQYCQFYQIIKSISFLQLTKIIEEIDIYNSKHESKFKIIPRRDLAIYSPDVRTITALYLTNLIEKPVHPAYFLTKKDIIDSIFIALLVTFFLLYFS